VTVPAEKTAAAAKLERVVERLEAAELEVERAANPWARSKAESRRDALLRRASALYRSLR
jgi:exonuclease VII small subunit